MKYKIAILKESRKEFENQLSERETGGIMRKYRFIAFTTFMLQLGTAGALQCDNIGIRQALAQLLIFGIIGYISAKKGGLFDDNM